MKLEWHYWGEASVLMNVGTQRNTAWVELKPEGWRIQLWKDGTRTHKGRWETIAHVPDLDAAKMIALLNVEGELV